MFCLLLNPDILLIVPRLWHVNGLLVVAWDMKNFHSFSPYIVRTFFSIKEGVNKFIFMAESYQR